jgi:maleate cis-trans isomerase
MVSVHTIRDWRGIKMPVGRCTTEELQHMRADAAAAADHIAHFIAEVDAELAERQATRSDQKVVTGSSAVS